MDCTFTMDFGFALLLFGYWTLMIINLLHYWWIYIYVHYGTYGPQAAVDKNLIVPLLAHMTTKQDQRHKEQQILIYKKPKSWSNSVGQATSRQNMDT